MVIHELEVPRLEGEVEVMLEVDNSDEVVEAEHIDIEDEVDDGEVMVLNEMVLEMTINDDEVEADMFEELMNE